MIELLPIWNYPDSTPAFYDSESLTAIQASAKVYGKMNEIVADYNAFATEWNKKLEEFEYVTVEEYHEFELSMRQELQDFIDTIDTKISDFEGDISTMENSVKWVKEQITSINQSIAIHGINISDLNNNIRNLDERLTTLENNQGTSSGSSKLYLHRVRFKTLDFGDDWAENPSFDFYISFYRTDDIPVLSLAEIKVYEMRLENPFEFTEYDAPEAHHYALGVSQGTPYNQTGLKLYIHYVYEALGWEQGSSGGTVYIEQDKFTISDTVYEV